MEFKDEEGHVRSTVKLNGRTIDRITLTLFDFGSLNDKGFTSALVNSMASAEYSPVNTEDETIVRGIRDLNKFVKKINKNREPLFQLLENPNLFSLSMWFICFEQLRMILQDAKTPQNFEDNFKLLRHFSWSMRNYYKEYALRKGWLTFNAEKTN